MTIIMFSGKGCPYCEKMYPIVEKLISEGYDIKILETWYNNENKALREKYKERFLKDFGEYVVPSFVDLKNDRISVGSRPYEKLKSWIDNTQI